MRTKSILLPILCLVFTASSLAQVQVFLHQPPPGQLNIADLWKFEVTNNTETGRFIKFYATVSSEEGFPIFEGTSSVFELSAMFSGVVSFPELEPFDMAHVDEEIKEILLRTGTVPSGIYVICLEVFDAESTESIYRDCIDQEVIQASPPVLVYPVDGSALEEEMPVFSWMEPVPPVDGMLYKIRISEILTDQSPEQALLTTPPYFEYGDIMGSLFEYPLSARPLEVGRNYAWRVTGTIFGRALLESEYSTFIRLDPTGAAAKIELTFPPDRELIDPKKTVFCWKPLPGDDIVYNVIVEKEECDTTPSTDESHPFGYLGDDPAIRRADSIRRAMENNDIPFWRAVCERLRENIEVANRNRGILSEQQRQFEEWAREIGCELTEPECNLPDCCPEGNCCADLDPSDPNDRAEFRRRVSCLTGRMRSMNEAIDDFADDFESLLERWRSGEDHRNTMGAYDDIFGALEYLMSMEWLEDLQQEVFDALGISQMMDELRNLVLTQICVGLEYTDEECQGFIEQLNELEQLLNDVKEGKENIETAIEVFNDLRSGRGLPHEIFLKLMENLYAAAGEATGTAVEGWENFWREMCATLQRAYRLNRCMQQLNEMIAQLEQDCPEFCREAQAQIEDEARRAAAEYDRLREERHDRWAADSTAFSNDLDNAIAEFADNLGSSGICCQNPGDGNVVYTFPPYGSDDPCKEYLYDLLSQQLGDRLCYFNIRIEINCETLEVNYTWETTEGFQRNEDCCPRVTEEETIGRTEGNPGEDEVCWPQGGDESAPGREGIDTGGQARWRVEAEREGRVIGRSSSRRYRTRPGYADPPTPDTIGIPRTPPGTGCDCQVRISINGFALPAGLGMIIEEGVSLNIKMDSGCSGTCVSASQSLNIQLPVLGFLGMHWVNPLFRAAGNQTNYQFNDPGTYKVTAKQICSDGSECEAVAVVEVKAKSKPLRKAKIDAKKNASVGKCGNSPCMHPYYYSDQDKLLIDGNEISFKNPGVYEIGYLSECFPQCSADKDVSWQITEPDGQTVVKSDQNLFEISHDFRNTGIYLICIIETAKCPNGDRQDSKLLVVEIE